MSVRDRCGTSRSTIVLRSGGTARIRSVAASGLCETIRRIGGDPDRLLRRARLSNEDLAEPDTWLFLADYCQLLEEVADAFACRTFGLDFGLSRSTAVLGDLGGLAATAPTLHAAFRALCRYMPTLQEQSAMRFDRHGESYILAYQIRDGHIVRRRQDAELTLGVLIGFIRSKLGSNWSPQEVHFEHPRSDPSQVYDRLLRAPVCFGQRRNAIVIGPNEVAAVVPTADPVRHAVLERRVKGRLPDNHDDDFIGIVLQEIRDGMATGSPGIETVARRLDLSGPALYRRLRTCGVEFSDLQRDLRRQIALMHVIEAHIPLTEVALLLGYSELSAFSRAFRSWTGVPAVTYRRRCNAGQSMTDGQRVKIRPMN